ncbi:MAG: hypothetical protein JWQ40_2784 [Segetibacter sp.]|nr:hypothetical protein [Segetibacter sp.]
MKTFISILRGINVSGQRRILMTDLKVLYESLGFKEVVTYIQSGNVIFKTGEDASNEELAKKIEQAITEKYEFEVPVIIRCVVEIEQVISVNPFLKNRGINTEKLHVTFLATNPTPATLQNMCAFSFPPDEFVIIGTEVFLHVPGSYGETKLSTNFFESKLKVSATTRNWKTVNKLLELARSK